jgi:tetratricopeptide (TPR) repeat protein
MDEHGAAADDSFELALDEEPAPAKSRAASPASPPAAKAPPPPPSPPPAQAGGGFDSLVGALEDELADVSAPSKGGPPPALPQPAARPPAAGASAPPQSGGALADVFDEFKAGMEEAGAEGDIETHFNMGVAFKEMHLYDEAIGEFQKAFQAAERSKNFTNFVQCCTLLAHCFMEKGEPRLAVRWLENALKAPGLGPEDVMALRYEIGSSHEQAGNKKAALESFMEVYALNIDYRDVADRIRQLKE